MIRRANPNDLDFINSIGNDFKCDFSKLYNTVEYINNSNYVVLVYEVDSIVVGFLICTIMYNELEIELICVDRNFRRRHYAQDLLEYVFENFSVQKALLEVSVDNIQAYNLYTKLGFIKIGERKGYYSGIDAIVMEKRC